MRSLVRFDALATAIMGLQWRWSNGDGVTIIKKKDKEFKSMFINFAFASITIMFTELNDYLLTALLSRFLDRQHIRHLDIAGSDWHARHIINAVAILPLVWVKVNITPVVAIVEPATGMQAVAATKTGTCVVELDVALFDLWRTFAS